MQKTCDLNQVSCEVRLRPAAYSVVEFWSPLRDIKLEGDCYLLSLQIIRYFWLSGSKIFQFIHSFEV